MTSLGHPRYHTSICLKYTTLGLETGKAFGIDALWVTRPYRDVRIKCRETNAVEPCSYGKYRFKGKCEPCKPGYECPGGWDERFESGWDSENKYYVDAMVKLCPQGHYCGIDGTVQQVGVDWKRPCQNKCTLLGSFKKDTSLFPSVCCSGKDRQIGNMCSDVTCPVECPENYYYHATLLRCKSELLVELLYNL